MGKNRIAKISPSAIVVLMLDLILLNICAVFAVLVTHNFVLDQNTFNMLRDWLLLAPVYCVSTVVVFYLFRLYHMIWSLVSFRELTRVPGAVFINSIIGAICSKLMNAALPISMHVLLFVLFLIATGVMRCSYRVLCSFLRRKNARTGTGRRRIVNVMIIGAGKAGQCIAMEMQQSKQMFNRKVCCIIDDNPVKHGRFLEGVPVVGGSNSILENVDKYQIDEIIFAIPTASPKQRHDILEICNQTDCTLKALPGIYQLIDGEVTLKALRDVSVEDLLAREPVRVDNEDILEKLRGKKILVTGGGGSIGSELCRQIAAHKPEQLIIFDIYENNAYDVQQELRRKYPNLNLQVQIGSVRDPERVERLFETFRPDVVFHAAAHKHVPLMEDSPCEAIKNNVFGTFNVAKMADKYETHQFVLISTDKAVNPTNIMGASKRLCEMVVQYMSGKSETKFVAVRFGNVLGSNGSVVPLFRRQIEEGGPVTVTDKDIIRYFMTIPEAVSLILQACAFAKNGEIYVLDMGEPVRIDDMARNMIRLCGLEPDVDIEIVYTGLRPGEKLFEELLMDEEGLRRTKNHLIFIGSPIEMDADVFEENLARLRAAGDANDPNIRELVAEIVPTYRRKQEPAVAH